MNSQGLLLKYSQIEESEDLTLRDIEQQLQEDRESEEQSKLRTKYRDFGPDDVHRGISLHLPVQKSEAGPPQFGEDGRISFPIIRYPEVKADPKKAKHLGAKILTVDIGPPKAKGTGLPGDTSGKERVEYLKMIQGMRDANSELVEIKGEEVPDEFTFRLPGSTEIFSYGKQSGQPGSWIPTALNVPVEEKGRMFTYLHPSLLLDKKIKLDENGKPIDISGIPEDVIKNDPEAYFDYYYQATPSLLKAIKQFFKSGDKGLGEKSPALNFIAMYKIFNEYMGMGKVLRENPHLKDEELIFNFFMRLVKESPQEKDIKKQNPRYRSMKDEFDRIYNKMEELCIENQRDPTVKNYSRLFDTAISERQTSDAAKQQSKITGDTRAIHFAINSVFRQILNGYFDFNRAFNEKNEVGATFSNFNAFIRDKLKWAMVKFYEDELLTLGYRKILQTDKETGKKSYRYIPPTLTETDLIGAEGQGKGLEDSSLAAGPSAEDVYMQKLEDEFDELQDSTDIEDAALQQYNKASEARKYILNNYIDKLAHSMGIKDILPQWTEQFKDFLIYNRQYMPADFIKILDNILPFIDFEYGVLPEDFYPCQFCGSTAFREGDRIEKSIVKIGKEKYQCRNCNKIFSRGWSVINSLQVPLLSFLRNKKLEYLKNEKLNFNMKIGMVEEIDKLMGFSSFKILPRGASRAGKGVSGRQVQVRYRNDKVYLRMAEMDNPSLSQLGVWSEVQEMPLSTFISEMGYPTQGFVGYDMASERYQAPYSMKSKEDSTMEETWMPTTPYERNEVINILIAQELLPILLKSPQIQEKFKDLPSVQLHPKNTIRNITLLQVQPLIQKTFSVLEDLRLRSKMIIDRENRSLSPEQQIEQPKTYTEMLQILPSEILDRAINHLQMEFSEEIPGINFPSIEKGIFNMINRTANILDTIASIQNVNSQEIPMREIMQFKSDPSAAGDPWQIATSTRELSKLEDGRKYQDVIQETSKNYEEKARELKTQETEINRIMDFILQNPKMGIDIPKDKSPNTIKDAAKDLQNKGILSTGVSLKSVEIALKRLVVMKELTQDIYATVESGQIPTENQRVNLASIIGTDLSGELTSWLVSKKSGQTPEIYSIIEASPLVKMLPIINSPFTKFSTHKFLEVLLRSASGMFGIAEQYEINPEYLGLTEKGKPIRHLKTPHSSSGESFYDYFRDPEKDIEFPRETPRFFEHGFIEDPYSTGDGITKPTKYKEFADRYSVQALVNDPRVSFYLDKMMEQYPDKTKEEIFVQLREEVAGLIKNFYLSEESQLFKDDPINSMRSIVSFFVPADLIDVCSDIWAKKMTSGEYNRQQRSLGVVENPFYIAASILFSIQDLIQRREDEIWDDDEIVRKIISDYNLYQEQENNQEWIEFINNLISKLLLDISTGKGCASRSLKMIENRDNLKYLSSRFRFTKTYYKGRYGDILNNIKTFIKIASKNMNNDLKIKLSSIDKLIDRELYG